MAVSHPSRVRGLKFSALIFLGAALYVAPFTGAWIEIRQIRMKKTAPSTSHPSRVRGLKSVDVRHDQVIF